MTRNLYTEILETKAPNYYQLLGLKLFKNDQEKIHKTGLAQLKELRDWDWQ